MIHFRKRSLKDRFCRLFPKFRKEQDWGLERVIRNLVENPDEPCVIEGKLIIPK